MHIILAVIASWNQEKNRFWWSWDPLACSSVDKIVNQAVPVPFSDGLQFNLTVAEEGGSSKGCGTVTTWFDKTTRKRTFEQ